MFKATTTTLLPLTVWQLTSVFQLAIAKGPLLALHDVENGVFSRLGDDAAWKFNELAMQDVSGTCASGNTIWAVGSNESGAVVTSNSGATDITFTGLVGMLTLRSSAAAGQESWQYSTLPKPLIPRFVPGSVER